MEFEKGQLRGVLFIVRAGGDIIKAEFMHTKRTNCLTKMKIGIHLNPISTGGGGCFPPPAQEMAQNSTTEQASTLKLGNFSKLGISKIFNLINQK